MDRPRVADVEAAAARLQGVVHETPLLPAPELDRLTGATLWLKAENLQHTGSFKLRGAYHRLATLAEGERQRGVVAASAGNHAQGVALAASLMGVPATIIMPETAPITKITATRRFGAEVLLRGAGFDAAFDEARRLAERRGRVLVHAFDDPAVVAGQGTVGLELDRQLPEVDALLVPVGGGGLAGGVAAVLKERRPGLRIIGVQAARVDAMARSFQAGRLTPVHVGGITLADGLAVKQPSELTFGLLRRYLDELVTVAEDAIARAILVFLERAKLTVEGAGAVGLAAMLSGAVELAGQRVALILSGGNIDINIVARVIDRGLVSEGRYLRIVTHLPDRPGSLSGLLQVLAGAEGNIIAIHHDRLKRGVAIGDTEIELILETRGHRHRDAIIAALRDQAYDFEVLES